MMEAREVGILCLENLDQDAAVHLSLELPGLLREVAPSAPEVTRLGSLDQVVPIQKIQATMTALS